MKKLITLVVLLGLAAMARADDAHDHGYVVNAAIYHNETLIATPVLRVLPGEEAGIEASYSEQAAYRLTLTVAPIDDTRLDIAARLKLAGEALAFSLILKPGQAGEIKIGARRLDLLVEKPGDRQPPDQD